MNSSLKSHPTDPTPVRGLIRFAAALFATGFFATAALAEVSLPNVFSDHMVLQRRQANRVWGKASPGEKVTVTIGGQSQQGTTDEKGNWQVMLVPMEASSTPVKLVAKGATNEFTVADVLV